MTLVNLKFRNTNISLDCDDVEQIKVLAARYNERLEELSANFCNTSDLKLALIAGLMVEEQIDTLAKTVESDSNTKGETIAVKKAFNDTISQISDYIDHLASRIEKR